MSCQFAKPPSSKSSLFCILTISYVYRKALYIKEGAIIECKTLQGPILKWMANIMKWMANIIKRMGKYHSGTCIYNNQAANCFNFKTSLELLVISEKWIYLLNYLKNVWFSFAISLARLLILLFIIRLIASCTNLLIDLHMQILKCTDSTGCQVEYVFDIIRFWPIRIAYFPEGNRVTWLKNWCLQPCS